MDCQANRYHFPRAICGIGNLRLYIFGECCFDHSSSCPFPLFHPSRSIFAVFTSSASLSKLNRFSVFLTTIISPGSRSIVYTQVLSHIKPHFQTLPTFLIASSKMRFSLAVAALSAAASVWAQTDHAVAVGQGVSISHQSLATCIHQDLSRLSGSYLHPQQHHR